MRKLSTYHKLTAPRITAYVTLLLLCSKVELKKMEGCSVLTPTLLPPFTDCPQTKMKKLLPEDAISSQEDYQNGCCPMPQLTVPNPSQ